MIPLDGRLSWRQTAPFHVQLELESSGQFRVPGEIRVHGRVVRVFRSDGRLALSDRVAFKLWVCRTGDEPTGPAYVYYDDFVEATHMEVYLHGTPPECELAAYEFTILNAPSAEPSMTVEQLEELLARYNNIWMKPRKEPSQETQTRAKRWWQFWKT